MLILLCAALLLIFGVGLMRGAGPTTLNRPERTYLWAASLPAILALVLPGTIAILAPGFEGQRLWGLRLNWAGCWLSVALILVGVFLLLRRSGSQEPADNRLVLGLVAAALPALLIGLVALLYAL